MSGSPFGTESRSQRADRLEKGLVVRVPKECVSSVTKHKQSQMNNSIFNSSIHYPYETFPFQRNMEKPNLDQLYIRIKKRLIIRARDQPTRNGCVKRCRSRLHLRPSQVGDVLENRYPDRRSNQMSNRMLSRNSCGGPSRGHPASQ